MRYWYHPESEALWQTDDTIDHVGDDPDGGLVVELTDEEYTKKMQELTNSGGRPADMIVGGKRG